MRNEDGTVSEVFINALCVALMQCANATEFNGPAFYMLADEIETLGKPLAAVTLGDVVVASEKAAARYNRMIEHINGGGQVKKALRLMASVAVAAAVVAAVGSAAVDAALGEMDYRGEVSAQAIREQLEAQAEDRRVAVLYGWGQPVEKAVENPVEPRSLPCPIF